MRQAFSLAAVRRGLSCSLVATFSLLGSAHAADLMKSSEVRSGMTGYGLSVFKGTRIERFTVTVLGVMRNAFPKMDMILIRCAGANLEHSGIVAGMSGSPIYLQVDGRERLIGALAYGWSFSKDPIAGVTPIHNMLEEAKRPLRASLPAEVAPATSSAPPASPAPNLLSLTGAAPATPSSAVSAFGEPPLRALLAHPQLKPAATPLFVSGAVGPLLQAMTPLLDAWNFVPMQGGGGLSADAQRASAAVTLEPGSAIGVQLMRGDLEMTGVGTVTYRDGDTVLAFGHPMMGIGELRFPVTTAYVQHTFAGLGRSFKMAGPIKAVGTLIQDRRPTIVAKMGAVVPMMPVKIVVTNPDTKQRDEFNMEVAQHRQFTPMLAFMAVMNSVQSAASDQADVSFEARLSLKLPGRAPIELRDHIFSPSGVLSFALFSSPVFRAMQELYANPFEEVRAESVEYQIELRFKKDLARIESVELGADALTPGTKARARLRMRPYLGAPYEERVEFDVPESLAGTQVLLQFAGGPNAPVDVAPPEGLPDIVRNLSARHPPKSIVVSMQSSSPSFKFRGQNLTDLPRTALDALAPQNAVGRGLVSSGLIQSRHAARHVIMGVRGLRVRVKRLDE